ncbi:hypothetical protein Tco_0452594 [Tanacetum coccineum]
MRIEPWSWYSRSSNSTTMPCQSTHLENHIPQHLRNTKMNNFSGKRISKIGYQKTPGAGTSGGGSKGYRKGGGYGGYGSSKGFVGSGSSGRSGG